MGNFIELSKRLNEVQYQTDEPEIFEQILTDVFNCLGLTAKHLGGPNEPDIVVEYNGEKLTVDTKTLRKKSGATEQIIGFPAQKRYKKKYNAYKAAVVAASFRKGNVLETAREEGVILIETKAICQLLYNHNISPYTSGEIFNLLFKGGVVMVSPEHIKSSLEENKKRMVEVIKDLIDILEKRKGQIAKFTLEKLKYIFIGKDKDYNNEDIESALELLLRLNILKKENQEYELTRGISEILEDIGILALIRGIVEPPFYPRKGGTIKPYGEIKKSSSKTLDHILEVVKLMKQGIDYNEACSKVAAGAKPKPVGTTTINSQCTRDLGINAESFKSYYNERKLEDFLKKRYPADAQAIAEVFR